MPLLILIFLGLYGWIEFEAFIVIGNAIGGFLTFLGVFFTAFIGIALMKRQGTLVLQQWQNNISKGEINTSTLANGLSLVFGAVFMLLPGYITDFIGLLFFIPGLRTLIGKSLLSQLVVYIYSSRLFSGFFRRFNSTDGFSSYNQGNKKPIRPSSHVQKQPLRGEVIEGQYESKDVPQK